MSVFDPDLSKLRQSTLRKIYLESTLSNLYAQRDRVQETLLILEKSKAHEQSDVDRLESHVSPLSLFYSLSKNAKKSWTRSEPRHMQRLLNMILRVCLRTQSNRKYVSGSPNFLVLPVAKKNMRIHCRESSPF